MTVFPAIGYTDPDQSHFTSRHYWEVGKLDPSLRTGWMGRCSTGSAPHDNPLQGLSLDGWLSPGAGDRDRSRSPRSTARATTSGRPASGARSRS